MTALTSFTLFPSLPPEVRKDIWAFACFVSRNVDIYGIKLCEGITGLRVCKAPEGAVPGAKDGLFYPHVFQSNSRIPAILHTSAESREEGLKWYNLSFGTNHSFDRLVVQTPPRIYVNFRVDRLCLMEYLDVLSEKAVVDDSDTLQQETEQPERVTWRDEFISECLKWRGNGPRYLALDILHSNDYQILAMLDELPGVMDVVLFDMKLKYRMVSHPKRGEVKFIMPTQAQLKERSCKLNRSVPTFVTYEEYRKVLQQGNPDAKWVHNIHFREVVYRDDN